MTRTFLPHVITDDSALGGAEIERSFRFNDNDNSHLSRTPSGAGNRKVWTWSGWVKRGNIGLSANATMLHAYDGSSSNRGVISFNTSDQLKVDQGGGSGSSKGQAVTTAKFRDISAWYHIVVLANYSDSTASDRVKVYVNGTQQTLTFNVAYTDENGQINGAFEHEIGAVESTNSIFDGYMAEIHFTDGYNYDASYFGYTEQQTGIWRHKKVTGITYGTNGFYLDFSDNSSITNICLDKSGNGNNFSPDNCNTEDSMIDTPTNNFATMTPLHGYGGLSQGNLRFNTYNDSSGPRSTQATIALPKSGKWYWEARYQESGTGTITTKYFGLSQLQNTNGYLTAPYVYYDRTHIKNGNSSEDITHGQDWYNGVGVPAILGCAINVDNNTVSFYHNNTLQGTITLPTLTTLQEYFFTWANTSGGSSSSLNDTFNFGADSTFQGQVSRGNNTDANGIGDFKYAPPSGHLALCSKNIEPKNIPSVIRPKRHFDTLLYTGNGSTTQNITGLEFKPDFVWIKRRDTTSHHSLIDSVRNGILGYSAASNTNQQIAEYSVSAFNINDNNSIDVPYYNNAYSMNTNSGTYVAWCWKAGGAAVTNTVGNISAQVSANDEAGFSIITYTGDGNSSGNVGTGLRSTQPLDWAIVKRRDDTSDWQVGHSGSGQGTNFAYHTNLNSSDALSGSTPYHMASQSATNGDRLYLATGGLISSATYVAYVWQERPGYSKFGKYVPNQSDDGPFVHLGFRPAWIMLKSIGNIYGGGSPFSGNWYIIDTSRDDDNPTRGTMAPPTDSGEDTAWPASGLLDILSDGFKLRTSSLGLNASLSGSFIYMAFAEQPGTTPFDTFPNAR